MVTGHVEPLNLRTEVDGGSAVIYLRGDLDMETGPVLADAFDTVFDVPADRVVVDLAEVDFLDSFGVRILLYGADRARRSGRVLSVREPAPVVDRVLRITGIAEYLGLPA